MGKRYTFKCNICEYEVMTAGGHDFGMCTVYETYTCRGCKEIVDVCVGELGNIYTIGEALRKKQNSETDLNFYACPKCGSETDLVKWNDFNRLCPKCDGQMVMDYFGKTQLSD